MEILSVNLKNFKIHQEQQFEFCPGINAICGENGAGKTSIIEAVAWVLFDYSGYSKTDLIRNGAKSAQAWVNFISQFDGRTYRVFRCTSKGYEIYDPQIGRTLGLKQKDDVNRWLRQQLGISSDLSLSNLFSEMIGIPQGTFTADFLKSIEGRKKVFDPILRVDDYKNAFQKAIDLKNYSQAKLQEFENQKQVYEQQLSDWDTLKATSKELEHNIHNAETEFNRLSQQLEKLQTEYTQLQAQAQHIQTLQQTQENIQLERQKLDFQHGQQQQQLSQAEEAAQSCQRSQGDYQAYVEISHTLSELEQQLQHRPGLEQEFHQQQNQLNQLHQELTQTELQLKQLAAAEIKISELEPLLPQQQALAANLQTIHLELTTLEQAKQDYQALVQEQTQLQASISQSQQEIHQLKSLQPLIAELPGLEAKYRQYQQQLSQEAVNQALHKQLEQLLIQAKLKLTQLETLLETAQGYLTTWPDSLLGKNIVETALNQGLEDYLQLYQQCQQLMLGLEPKAATELESKIKQLSQQLATAHQAEIALATLPTKQAQAEQQQQLLQERTKQLQKIQARLEQLPHLEHQAQISQQQLTALADPQAQIQYLSQQLQQKITLEQRYLQQNASIQAQHQQIQALKDQLQLFLRIEQQRQSHQKQQQQYLKGYQLYLQHQTLAEQVAPLQAQLQELAHQQVTLEQQAQSLQQQLATAQQNHNPHHLAQLQSTTQQIHNQISQLQGSLPLQRAHLQKLQQELEQRTEIHHQLTQLNQAWDKQKRIDEFIQISRQIFNQSGPRITRYYMTSIVQVADQLFRELLDRPDVALAWSDDYEIRVQEMGHWRNFKSLSGGEQMCAALAIRLALLKVLVEIDIAFFDEPTTNMDQMRRSQLATALSNLRSFQQLFVISHDDAFEQITENIIRVVR